MKTIYCRECRIWLRCGNKSRDCSGCPQRSNHSCERSPWSYPKRGNSWRPRFIDTRGI